MINLRFPDNNSLKSKKVTNLDDIFIMSINLLNTNKDIYSVAFAQAGDFIGGLGSHGYTTKLKRKCMNSWICKTDRKFVFNGIMNDDVNTYTYLGSVGKLFFTINDICIVQPLTQQISGGMTDIYSNTGTYQKSFYTLIQCPSFIQLDMMGWHNYRIHHKINWENAVPKIISHRFKKS